MNVRRHSWSLCFLVLFTGTALAERDVTLTPRARAVLAQADNAREAEKQRLQRQFSRLEREVGRERARALERKRRGVPFTEEQVARLDELERALINARADLNDLLVVSDGSFDRFRARVEVDVNELRKLLRRQPAE